MAVGRWDVAADTRSPGACRGATPVPAPSRLQSSPARLRLTSGEEGGGHVSAVTPFYSPRASSDVTPRGSDTHKNGYFKTEKPQCLCWISLSRWV